MVPGVLGWRFQGNWSCFLVFFSCVRVEGTSSYHKDIDINQVKTTNFHQVTCKPLVCMRLFASFFFSGLEIFPVLNCKPHLFDCQKIMAIV